MVPPNSTALDPAAQRSVSAAEVLPGFSAAAVGVWDSQLTPSTPTASWAGRFRGYNGAMTSRAQALLREALALGVEERADVAAELLASLDDSGEDPNAVEAAWAAEVERRAHRVLAGGPAGSAWQEVRGRAESDLRNR